MYLKPSTSHSPANICLKSCCCVCCVLSRAGTSNSLQSHGLWSVRLLCPCNFPGKNTGVGCHALLQGIFPTWGSNLCLPASPALQADSLSQHTQQQLFKQMFAGECDVDGFRYIVMDIHKIWNHTKYLFASKSFPFLRMQNESNILFYGHSIRVMSKPRLVTVPCYS